MEHETIELSVVAPVYDERGNLERLHERVAAALDGVVSWELVLVDDGSKDGSAETIRDLARTDPRVRGVFLGRNHGQSTALLAGIADARGERIATLDADLQNDPADFVAMIERLETCDAVVGVRHERRDTWVRRTSSRVAKAVRDRILGDRTADTGCALRVMRAEAARAIPPFDGMHRFVPMVLRWRGFEVVEMPIAHRDRDWGRSKYGISNRLWRGLYDLFGVRWMRSRLIRAEVLARRSPEGEPSRHGDRVLTPAPATRDRTDDPRPPRPDLVPNERDGTRG